MKNFAKKYFDLLVGEYKGINLTRINTFDEFYNKQIIDSVKPQEVSKSFSAALSKQKLLIDVGFGGGFPILPLAFKNPKLSFVGVETRGKKVKVVGEISSKLGLKNTKFVHSRIEHLFIDVPALVCFKAVGKVHDFLSKINTDQKLQVYFYKGPNFYTLEAEQLLLAKNEWKIIEEVEIKVEGTEKRYLIGFENVNVPCGTNTNSSKNLVKLSQLL
jgi:16S rRNA (guanine527-N7)-methyltransferase